MSFVFKDGDEIAEPVNHVAAAELFRIAEVRVGQLVGIGERRDDFLVDVIPMVGLPLSATALKPAPGGMVIGANGFRRICRRRT